MSKLAWTARDAARLAAIRDELAQVSTATAFQLLQQRGRLLQQRGRRNTYIRGVRLLQELVLGRRLVGRARTCQYLLRRGAEHASTAREELAALAGPGRGGRSRRSAWETNVAWYTLSRRHRDADG